MRRRSLAMIGAAAIVAVSAGVAPAGAATSTVPTLPAARNVQVNLQVLSASGTIETRINGSWDQPVWLNPLRDENLDVVSTRATADITNTITWRAPKQRGLQGVVFGPSCPSGETGCTFRLDRVSGSSQSAGSITYADGTIGQCAGGAASLTRDNFFSDSASDTLFVHHAGTRPKTSVMWVQGGYFTAGIPDTCEWEANIKGGLVPTSMKVPLTRFTKAPIGKPFSVTIQTVDPLFGYNDCDSCENGREEVQIGTVTWRSTIKVVVKSRN